jgi:hypothetical protein
MKQKPANKLEGLQGEQFDLIVVRRIPPSKGDLVALQFDQPVIGEGYPMSVPTQIVHHLFRIFQRGLTINHPRLTIKIREESFKGRRFLQFLDLSWKPEFPSLILPFQPIQEFASKQRGEHMDWDEEVFL